MGYSPKEAPNVYRLIGAALIRIFFMILLILKSNFWSNVENTLRWDSKGYPKCRRNSVRFREKAKLFHPQPGCRQDACRSRTRQDYSFNVPAVTSPFPHRMTSNTLNSPILESPSYNNSHCVYVCIFPVPINTRN